MGSVDLVFPRGLAGSVRDTFPGPGMLRVLDTDKTLKILATEVHEAVEMRGWLGRFLCVASIDVPPFARRVA